MTTVVVLAIMLTGGCSPGSAAPGQRVVFRVATGFSQSLPATTADIVDIGLPDLHNITGNTVRVRGISLVGATDAVHIHSITAYSYLQTRGVGMGLIRGDLLKHCRRSYKPYPIADAVTPRHSGSNWFIVIALNFAKPGRYYLGRVQIDFTTSGQEGWQYQNLYTTIVIKAARKGQSPAFAGCP